MRVRKMGMRNEKRRDVVGAIVTRTEPIHDAFRIFNFPLRTILDWLGWFWATGWDGLNDRKRSR